MKNVGKGIPEGNSVHRGMDLPGGCRVGLGNLDHSKQCYIFRE